MERTQVGQEVEEALGEVLAHVRGEVARIFLRYGSV